MNTDSMTPSQQQQSICEATKISDLCGEMFSVSYTCLNQYLYVKEKSRYRNDIESEVFKSSVPQIKINYKGSYVAKKKTQGE